MSIFYSPELIYLDGEFVRGKGILVDDRGYIQSICGSHDAGGSEIVNLPGRALLPGFVNAHSHSFQRLIRGKSESRIVSGHDFWSWRGTMYHAAAELRDRKSVV